ncbi:MAG: hypothetical protein KDC67_06065 [Ignavibacteriae bacterium]|nr:hypothetical protein [Ignavibacteriota bacterium]
MIKQVWIYDIETISNFFSYVGYNINTGEYVYFVIWKETNHYQKLVNHLTTVVNGMIGFNNLAFDYPVLHYMLDSYDKWKDINDGDALNFYIYKKAQEVIEEKWSNVREDLVKIPQLDLFKIWHFDNVARMTSLKKLQIAMRYDNVQDMPYKHYDVIETNNQAREILLYNKNDVKSTYDFYLKSSGKIQLRKDLYKRYHLNCLNYSDSKIGEELTLKLYCEATGSDIFKVRGGRTYRKKFEFKKCFPSYLKFTTDTFKKLQSYLTEIEVTELKNSFKYFFEYRGFEFHLGTGGIHGAIKSGVYQSTEENIIIDVDVASLYPSLAITNKLYPSHLGKEFLVVYEDGIVKPRLEAKKAGDTVMADGFKLSANSVYGKSNSSYSWLYDPLYTIKTTLAGQLALCMLSEQLFEEIEELIMLQINTDGTTVIIPKNKKDEFYDVCKKWEQQTGLTLEYKDYKRMIIRDVNSYIAEDFDGKLKRKGTFCTYDDLIKNDDYHKSFNQMIVPQAISNYFINNIPVEETINNCTNIYDFCKTFNASAGWTCETEKDNIIIPQQKNNRYFVSKNGATFRKLKDDKIIEIEAGGTLVTVFNKFQKREFSEYEVDYDYYINECYKIIHKIDGTEERENEETKRLREEEKRKNQEEKFIKYCVEKQPTIRQYELYAKDWLLEKYGKIEIRS